MSEESQLIPIEDRNSKVKRSKLRTISRMFLQRKKRSTAQACLKKRVKYLHSRMDYESDPEDVLGGLCFSEEADECTAAAQMNTNRRRRMATCDQLEKVTSLGDKITLYELRKALVVIDRLQNFGLI